MDDQSLRIFIIIVSELDYSKSETSNNLLTSEVIAPCKGEV